MYFSFLPITLSLSLSLSWQFHLKIEILFISREIVTLHKGWYLNPLAEEMMSQGLGVNIHEYKRDIFHVRFSLCPY